MRIVFIGTGEIGVPVLRSLLQSEEHELVGVVTQPDKPAGRDATHRSAADQSGAGRQRASDSSTGTDQTTRRRSRKFVPWRPMSSW